ncbi:nucleoside triphosphate pyrophosphohydrolase [Streptomyces catenulae]|uniref:Nucleoside triphosphate pyrophosphohydrolase n=1 Tax=Streptomyces catenulae TaxID=66875 RepID=A0ABV2Z302_9ACTN|nr:nucleoside triphosphate pyrophosphohydrolase [Streptomyces catenulae]
MNCPVDGKLVRDEIPRIIQESGADPHWHVAGPQEYRRRLRHKLSEEVREVLGADESSAPDELADVMEVVHALAGDLGVGPEELEAIRKSKAAARGGFAGRVVWMGNR